jgi:hypothetical protein
MAKSSSARVARRVANKSETSVPSTADVKALTGSDAGNAMKGRNFTVASSRSSPKRFPGLFRRSAATILPSQSTTPPRQSPKTS